MNSMAQDMETDAVNVPRMDYLTAVMKMDNELHDEDVESLKFLCQGHIPSSKLKRIDTAHELVELLEGASLASSSDFFILADLLQYISRVDVLEAIGYDEREVLHRRHHNGSQIKPFYVLLFKIAEELTNEDVKKAVFMYGKVPNAKKISNGMDLFTIMCQHNVINPDNPGLLVQIFTHLERNDVVELVRRYSVSQGESVMQDLERQFIRSMQLRGHDYSGMFSTPSAAPQGKGLGPRPEDIDIPRSMNSSSSSPPSGLTSMANHPSSCIVLAPFTPGENFGPSAHNVPNSGPQEYANRANVPSAPQPEPQQQPEPHAVPGQVKMTYTTARPVLFDSAVVPWSVVDNLAQTIPEHYWPEFSYQLGIHFSTQWSTPVKKEKLYTRNIALLKQWLEQTERDRQDEVTVRMTLVRALAKAGPELMANSVAEELNVDLQVAIQMSFGVSRQESAYEMNETASEASAAPESLPYTANVPQPGDRGDLQVVHQFQHLCLAPASVIPYYSMESFPKGICIIINNRDFYKDDRFPEAKQMINREGTDVDRDKLADTFQNLHFQVRSYDNLTDTRMLHLMQQIGMEDHTAFDCFVCCVLTHGVLGALYGVNGMTIPIKELTGPLRAQSCPSLAGKPKLFFMQACQGKEKQPGHDIQMDAATVDLETDGPGQLIPNEADFLLGYATVPGFVSYRSKTRGSWYITKLTEMLRKYAYDHDILDILTLVNYEVGKGDANMDGGTYKQSPAPMYSLRKKLIFSRPLQSYSGHFSLR